MKFSYTSLTAAVLVVDFVTLILHRIFDFGSSLSAWYTKFGITAVLSDCLIIVIGILIADFFVPGASALKLAGVSVVVQMIHDVLFYLAIIIPIPMGHNSMIDLFKHYAKENGGSILGADAAMIASTVFLTDYYEGLNSKVVVFVGLVALYGLTYSIYTK